MHVKTCKVITFFIECKILIALSILNFIFFSYEMVEHKLISKFPLHQFIENRFIVISKNDKIQKPKKEDKKIDSQNESFFL